MHSIQPFTASERQQAPQAPSVDSLVSSTIGLVAVFLSNIFAIRHLVSRAWRRNNRPLWLLAEFYSDEDGEATADSVRASSRRRIRRLPVIFATVGGCVSGAHIWISAWHRSRVPIEDLLQGAIWVRINWRCSLFMSNVN